MRTTRTRYFAAALGGLVLASAAVFARAEDTGSAVEPGAVEPGTTTVSVSEPNASEPIDSGTSAGSAFQAQAKRVSSFSPESLREMTEKITVTARRREERVQRVPVAVTVLSGDELASQNLDRRLQDVQNLVPNLVFDGSTGFTNTSRVVLRGFGQADPAPTADPGVGVYVDGVYQARSTGLSLTPLDIDRVEVLRGPQGTLFGKNTVGGAITVTTRKPDLAFGGSAQLRVGNFQTFESRAVVNVPLIPEKAAARLSFATATRDGYTKNEALDQDTGDNKVLAGRGELLAYPSENVEVLLSLDLSKENRTPVIAKCIPTGDPNSRGAMLAAATGVLAACEEDQRRSEFKGANNLSSFSDFLRTAGSTARVTWDINPNLTFTSISGFRKNVVQSFIDVDSTEVPLLGNDNDSGREVQKQASQEFQLTGNTASNRLRYTLGLFALVDNVNNREFFSLMQVPTPMGILPNPALTGMRLKVRNRSYALFGQGVYALSDRLELTFGARLTEERKRVLTSSRPTVCRPGAPRAACDQALAMPVAFGGFESSARFADVSPAVSLSYQLSPQVLTYVSYSTAFQSGGFQGNAQRVEDSNELDPQEVTSYELGIKSRGFDDRLLFNASFFYNIVDDARIPFTNTTDQGGFTVTERNAAKTLIRGGEVELGARVAPGLQLFATAGVINSRFVEFDDDVPDPSIEDNRPPFTPNYTLNFRLDYERPLGSFGTLGLQSSYSVRGRMNTDAQATDALQTARYGLLDGRISLTLPDGRTELAAYGTNLTDRRYFNNGISFADAIGVASRFFGPPRFYGVEIRRNF